jgi:hypothetical protein
MLKQACSLHRRDLRLDCVLAMDIGIVYHIENAHQFWEGMSTLLLVVAVLGAHSHTELKDILSVSRTESLSRIDNALKSFVSFCAEYDGNFRGLGRTLTLIHLS